MYIYAKLEIIYGNTSLSITSELGKYFCIQIYLNFNFDIACFAICDIFIYIDIPQFPLHIFLSCSTVLYISFYIYVSQQPLSANVLINHINISVLTRGPFCYVIIFLDITYDL